MVRAASGSRRVHGSRAEGMQPGCSHLRVGEQSKLRRTLGVALWQLEGDAGRSSTRTWRKEDV